MSKASLPFWNQGTPFDPKVYPEDVAAYAQRENELMAPVHEARAAFQEGEAILQDLQAAKAKHVDVAKARNSRDRLYRAFLKADETAKDPVLKLQADFITAALKKEAPPLKGILKLTVAEIRGGFNEVWTAAHDWRKEDPAPRPLGNDGATSAPSPSPA